MIKWAGHATRREMRNACKILVRRPERKTPLGRSKCRVENNIRMEVQQIG
jgi:hypothetical protein